ncbi:MAG TPA: serine/threonine-protein kinase [Gemmatimonadaceae bacterium]|nr:serine/threonine-protein kinase [Gemmatimonadaceae bacterium]
MTIVDTSVQTANAFDIGLVRSALDADYEVIEELGRGGMAVVYRAKERALDREVAIKVLPAILSIDQDFVDRFEREARTAGQLEHPNIVPIYRVGRVGHIIFFVMKFLRGQSLAGILRERGKLSGADVRRILIETGSALGYAAKRGVVHRDIKPDNILLDSEGRCVVTDFGIAKTASGPRTAAGTSMGTPRYMSPEHAQGIPVDGRSDIYSLGIVAYELLTGVTPFTGEDPFAVLYKHINAPLPIPDLNTDEEKQVFGVIERMLAKNPDERYQHAYELIAALGGEHSSTTLISGGVQILQATIVPTEIIHTGRLERFRRRIRGDRRAWFAAGGGVVLAAGLLAVFWPWSKPEAVVARPTTISRADTGARTAGTSTAAVAAGDTMGARAPVGSSPLAKTASVVPAATKTASVPRVRPGPPSRCPASPKEFSLLVDSVRNYTEGRKLEAGYDICGLPPSTAFTGIMTVRRIRQSRLKRLVGGSVSPITQPIISVTRSPRTHLSQAIDISTLPPGTYQLDVVITLPKRAEKSRQFEIVEKRAAR